MGSTLLLIKTVTISSLFLSYEQLYITDLRKSGQLIHDQNVWLVLSPSTNPSKAQPVVL
jgi:hypothetical protein